MAKVNHRSTPNSKQGRRLFRIGLALDLSRQSKEVSDWNAAVEAKKEAKRQAKLNAKVSS